MTRASQCADYLDVTWKLAAPKVLAPCCSKSKVNVKCKVDFKKHELLPIYFIYLTQSSRELLSGNARSMKEGAYSDGVC